MGKKTSSDGENVSQPKIVGPMFPDCAKVPGEGGGPGDAFFVRCRVDNGVLVEVRRFLVDERCIRATQSIAWDRFRLWGARRHHDPPALVVRETDLGLGYALRGIGLDH